MAAYPDRPGARRRWSGAVNGVRSSSPVQRAPRAPCAQCPFVSRSTCPSSRAPLHLFARHSSAWRRFRGSWRSPAWRVRESWITCPIASSSWTPTRYSHWERSDALAFGLCERAIGTIRREWKRTCVRFSKNGERITTDRARTWRWGPVCPIRRRTLPRSRLTRLDIVVARASSYSRSRCWVDSITSTHSCLRASDPIFAHDSRLGARRVLRRYRCARGRLTLEKAHPVERGQLILRERRGELLQSCWGRGLKVPQTGVGGSR